MPRSNPSHQEPLIAPRCPKGHSPMPLVRMPSAQPGYDERTYECSRCDQEVTEVIKFRRG